MPVAHDNPRRSGFTLLEVLIVVAIFGIVVVTVVALVTSILDQKKQAKGRIDVYDGTSLALATLSFDVANAGYRFPVPAFAFRVINNVSGATILSQTGQGVTPPTITTTSNCAPDAGVAGSGGEGLLIGTDVIELAEGLDSEGVGTVASVTLGGTSSTVRFKDLGNIQFLANGSGSPVDTVVLFSDNMRNSCLAKVTIPGLVNPNPGSNSLNFTYLDPDFGPAISTPANCPRENMSAFRIGKRTRYMICQDNSTAIPGGKLYRQTSLSNLGAADSMGNLNLPTLVLDNIVDLQVGLRLAVPMLGTAPNLSPNSAYGSLIPPNQICTSLGDRQYCDCLTSTPCTGTDLNGAPLDFTTKITNEQSHLNWVRSAILAVTARSLRSAATSAQKSAPSSTTVGSPMLMIRQIQLLDSPIVPPTGNTGYLYGSTQQVVGLANFLEVTP